MKNKNKELLEAIKEYLKFYDYLRQFDTNFEQKDIENIDNALLRLRKAVDYTQSIYDRQSNT